MLQKPAKAWDWHLAVLGCAEKYELKKMYSRRNCINYNDSQLVQTWISFSVWAPEAILVP